MSSILALPYAYVVHCQNDQPNSVASTVEFTIPIPNDKDIKSLLATEFTWKGSIFWPNGKSHLALPFTAPFASGPKLAVSLVNQTDVKAIFSNINLGYQEGCSFSFSIKPKSVAAGGSPQPQNIDLAEVTVEFKYANGSASWKTNKWPPVSNWVY